MSGSSADLTVYAGDFNTEPGDVPYKLVRHVTPLSDAWEEAQGPGGGETSETPGNSYTGKYALKECPQGRRIDYIMYNSGPNIRAETVYCTLPMSERIPGKNISYSDHEGVTAKLRLRRSVDSDQVTGRDYARAQSVKNIDRKLECVDEAKEILKRSVKTANHDRIMGYVFSVACILLMMASFITHYYEQHLAVNILMFLIRLVLIVLGSYCFLMSLLFFKKEVHALKGTLASLELIRESCLETSGAGDVHLTNGEIV